MRSFIGAVAVAAIAAGLSCAKAQVTMQRGQSAQDGGGSSLTPRIERLEEQLVDLQGVVAAVETLAKTNAGGGSGYAAASAGGVSSDQLRQLSEQIADLTQRIERLEARLGTEGANPARSQSSYGAAPLGGFEDKQQLPPLSSQQTERPARHSSASAQPYGGGNVRPPARAGVGAGDVTAPRTASQSAAVSGPSSGSARELFDQGYGALNRREYSAAENYFQQFLTDYPSDPLAGLAQYWLGETAFVSGEYRSAADRFLKAFTNYPSSEKAPEALLKLAISLRRLGENSAACDSFAELRRRFPQAPSFIQQRADIERKRANCS